MLGTVAVRGAQTALGVDAREGELDEEIGDAPRFGDGLLGRMTQHELGTQERHAAGDGDA